MDLELIKNKLRYPQEYGQATPEEAKFAYDNGYMGGEKTQEYYKELGLLDPKPTEPEPQPKDPTLQFTDNPNGAQDINFKKSPLDMWNPFGAQQDPEVGAQNKLNATLANGAIDPTKMSDQLATDQRKQDLDYQADLEAQDAQEKNLAKKEFWDNAGNKLRSINDDFNNYSNNTSNALAAWNPVVTGALGGVDRSGEAAGYAAQAAQNQYNAVQNEKLRQANMQQAMDNTIADKMAAAEAESKWKQNARALGAEGGAQAVASQNEAVTPDLWKQKQLQNERRDVAAQNLAEVNRNKLMAIGNETNEAMTNYATNVEDSQNAYKASLANAQGKAEGTKKEDTETSESKDTDTTESKNIDTTETKTENTGTKTDDTETQPTGTESEAVSNQESEGVQTVTDQMKAQQIHDRIEALYKETEEAAKSHDANRVKALANEYDQLVADFEALPKEVQQIGYRQFDPRHLELNAENADYDYSAIANAVNDRTM